MQDISHLPLARLSHMAPLQGSLGNVVQCVPRCKRK